MAKNIKEIWKDAYTNGQVKNVVWKVKKNLGFMSVHHEHIREDAMHVDAAAELYHAANAYGKEIKRLRKVLVENGLAEYNSDGEFVENFTSSTEPNIKN